MTCRVLLEIVRIKGISVRQIGSDFEGDFDELKWSEFENVAALLKRVVVNETGMPDTSIEIRSVLINTEGYCQPAKRLIWMGDGVPANIHGVITEVANHLIDRDCISQELFPGGSNLSLSAANQQEVKSFLSDWGGIRVQSSIRISAEGQTCAELTGTFSARPQDSLPGDTRTKCIAVVEEMSAPARKAKLNKLDDTKKIEISYAEPYRQILAESLGLQLPLAIEIEESLDGRGKRFISVVDASMIETDRTFQLIS